MASPAQTARARLGAHIRNGAPPADIAAARAELAAATAASRRAAFDAAVADAIRAGATPEQIRAAIDAAITADVATWPALTPDQAAGLARVLRDQAAANAGRA